MPAEAFKALRKKEVDILIGLNMNQLQPAGGMGSDKVGELSALWSLFGTGWVIGGHHDTITSGNPEVVSPAAAVLKVVVSPAAAVLKVAKIRIEPQPSLMPEFWEGENLGVMPSPRCNNCRSCMSKGPCSEKHYSHSIRKLAELDLIREKTKLVDGEIWCDYPYIKDPSCLKFNRGSAIKVDEKVEKELLSDNLHEAYNHQILDQLKRGVAVKLSDDEINS